MQYMLLIYSAEACWTEEERRECMEKSQAICDELAAAGKFVTASPLHSVTTATTLRLRDGKRQITDGPFAETTEQLGGLFIIDVDNLDEALAIAGRLPPAQKGSVEIRPVFDLSGLRAAGEDRTFVNSRTLPFSRQAVFQAFATPEMLARWWGPEGFTNTFHEFDFRPGGDWRFVMHGPNGANYENHNVFRAIVSPELIAIEHLSAPHFHLTVTLAPAGEQATRIIWRMEFDSAQIAESLSAIIVPANEQNFDRLTEQLSMQRR